MHESRIERCWPGWTSLVLASLVLGCGDGGHIAGDASLRDGLTPSDQGVDAARPCPAGHDTRFGRGCFATSEPFATGAELRFDGFGAGTTGGAEGPLVTVTSYADDGPGTLRQLLRAAQGPLTLRFATSGTIALKGGAVRVPSNVTLDARGVDLTISGYGLRLEQVENIALINLAFVDIDDPTGGDGVQIIDSRRVVIWHCRFDSGGLTFVEDIPDEQISVVWGATDITIAWCRFVNHDKVLLIGNGDAPAAVDSAIRVTVHHSWFENTGRRHPFLRHGRVDLVNNVIRGWRPYLLGAYGSRSQAQGELRVERNLYHQPGGGAGIAVLSLDSGRVALVDNSFEPSSLVRVEVQAEQVFARPYPLRVDQITDRYIAHLERWAGNTLAAP